MRAVAFTGPSGSGKTTLVEKISLALQSTRRVGIIKHDPSDKARFDQEGKDSDRFYKSGAQTAVVSPTRTTLFLHHPQSIEQIAVSMGELDLLMVEGLRTLPLPRIGIFRGTIDTDYLPLVKAIAIDDTIDRAACEIPGHVDVLDLNDTESIIAWIEAHAKQLDLKNSF